MDYESELVVVIGKPCHRIDPDEALDYVLGYSCGNDVSARPLQLAEMATGVLMLGKGLETFKPLGPVIATDLDPTDLRLRGRHQRGGYARYEYVGPAVQRGLAGYLPGAGDPAGARRLHLHGYSFRRRIAGPRGHHRG